MLTLFLQLELKFSNSKIFMQENNFRKLEFMSEFFILHIKIFERNAKLKSTKIRLFDCAQIIY